MGGDGPRRWRRAGAAMAAAGLASLLPTPAAAGDAVPERENYAVSLMGPALVRVQASFAGPGPQTATCTGFFVHHRGYAVTAADCVERLGAALQGPVTVTVGEGVADHAPRPAQVLGVSGDGDGLALLHVPGLRHLPALGLAETVPADAARVAVGGYRTVTTTIANADHGTYVTASLDVTAGADGPDGALSLPWALQDGMVGGPVSEYGGTAVAVAVAVAGSGTEATTRLTPAPRIAALLARHRVANDVGPAGRAYAEGLRLATDEDWEPAAEALGRALALNPHLVLARRAYEVAVETPKYEASREDDGTPTGLVVGLAGAGVLAVAGTVALIRRRRRKAPALPGLEPS